MGRRVIRLAVLAGIFVATVHATAVEAAVTARFQANKGLLIVKGDGKVLLEQIVDSGAVSDGWAEVAVDLSPFAGKTVNVEIINQPNDWRWGAAYWAKIEVSKD